MIRGPIAQATLRTSAVLGLRLLVQAGTLLIVARLLGPHDFGAFAGIVALAVMLGTLSTFGTHLLLLREVSLAPGQRPAVLPFALGTTVACGGALLAIYTLVAWLWMPHQAIGMTAILAIGVTEVLLMPLLTLPAMELQGQGHIARSQWLMTSPLILRLLLAAGIDGAGIAPAVDTYTVGTLLLTGTVLLLTAHHVQLSWPPRTAWRLPQRAEMRQSLGFAAVNLTFLGPVELDKTLAPRLMTLSQAGVYAASARVAGALTLPVVALMLSALPRLFRESESSGASPRRLVAWIYGASFGYSLCVMAALWFLAPLLDLAFGQHYHGIGELTRWFIPAVPGMALRIASGSLLVARGRTWTRIRYEALGMVLLATFAVLLTPRMGDIGMPLAVACAEWTMAVLGCLTMLRQSGKHPAVRPTP